MNEVKHLVAWYQGALDSGGYLLIVLLMAMESTIVPIPSEVIVPFAAHLAHTNGKMTLWGVVVAAALGSWAGATIMYWASRAAGRPLVVRYGGYFMVSEAKLQAAELWASRFGSMGVFIARLLPVVRHLIGIPMGIVKMDFPRYSLFTLIGSALWSAVLAWIGVKAGDDPKILQGDVRQWTILLGGAVLVLGALYYFFVRRHMRDPKRS